MESKTTTAFAAIKQDVRMNEWMSQIQAQKASGMTIQQWCEENGVNIKTYYYRLRKVREQCVDVAPAIVPLSVPSQQGSDIIIKKGDLQISLPPNIPQDTLIEVVCALC